MKNDKGIQRTSGQWDNRETKGGNGFTENKVINEKMLQKIMNDSKESIEAGVGNHCQGSFNQLMVAENYLLQVKQ